MRNLSGNCKAIKTAMSHHLSVPKGAAVVVRLSAVSHRVCEWNHHTFRGFSLLVWPHILASQLFFMWVMLALVTLWGGGWRGAEEASLPSDR